MKKLLITSLLLISSLTFNLQGLDWGDIGDAFKNAADKVGDAFKTAAEKVGEGFKIAGEKIADCSKVVGLGTAWVSTKASSGVMEAFQKSSEAVAFESAKATLKAVQTGGEYVAFESAKGVLEATKKTVSGTLDFANTIQKNIMGNIKIQCFRFLGTLDNVQLEFQANVLGKNIYIKEAFKAKNLDDLTNQIYNRIMNTFNLSI